MNTANGFRSHKAQLQTSITELAWKLHSKKQNPFNSGTWTELNMAVPGFMQRNYPANVILLCDTDPRITLTDAGINWWPLFGSVLSTLS